VDPGLSGVFGMKPRLKVEPLTDEDCRIWGSLVRRASSTFPILKTSRAIDSWNADRRDAELMLKFRMGCAPSNPANMLFWATYGLPYYDSEAIVAGWIRGFPVFLA
jgi:hypothetical protein